MTEPLQILIIEDAPADVVLMNRELRRAGLNFRSRRVDTKAHFLQELHQRTPDLILSDHGLPQFDGFTALAIAQDQCPDVPFIFVTGSMGEQVAIETFKGGATDYVLKEHLEDLAPSVMRALRLGRERQRRHAAEQALRESEEHFRTLVDGVHDYAIFMLDTAGCVTTWNAGAEWNFGFNAQEILGCNMARFYLPEAQAAGGPANALHIAQQEGRHEEELELVRKGNACFWANVTITALREPGGKLRGYANVIRDISEKKRSEVALRRSENSKRVILETALDAIVALNHEGRVQEWNPAAERMFGYSRDKAIEQTLDRLIIPKRLLDVYRDGLATYLMTGVGSLIGRPIELALRRRDGAEFWAEIAIACVQSEGPVSYTLVAHDIDQRRHAEEQYRRLNEELEQRVTDRTTQLEAANRELEAFSYSVSHDLRTPLRHVSGFVQMLQEQSTLASDEECRGLVQRIGESTQRMTQLIDGLLALSRLGRAELRKIQVNLEALVSSVIAELRQDLGGRRVDWELGPLVEVDADPTLLRQVMVNLLSNALKFTSRRVMTRIEISARETPQEVICTVRDNGVGFNMDYAGKLFGVFQRLHRAADYDGTGIGLALVRTIIQRHGGRTWAEGVVNEGAAFHFSLPVRGQPHTENTERKQHESHESPHTGGG